MDATCPCALTSLDSAYHSSTVLRTPLHFHVAHTHTHTHTHNPHTCTHARVSMRVFVRLLCVATSLVARVRHKTILHSYCLAWCWSCIFNRHSPDVDNDKSSGVWNCVQRLMQLIKECNMCIWGLNGDTYSQFPVAADPFQTESNTQHPTPVQYFPAGQ
jgi:hypothetical protein